MQRKKLGILVSGRGTNMQAIIEAAANSDYPAEVSLVLSNRSEAPALKRAEKFGIEAVFIPGKGEQWEKKALNLIEEKEIDLICLAGFMRVLSPRFIEKAPPIMNIHPSLLPAFPGLEAQKQALDYGVKISGCTVHFVDAGVDTGPIILQKAVVVEEDDDVETLSRRILKQEHHLYPRAISLWARGKLKREGRMVKIKEAEGDER